MFTRFAVTRRAALALALAAGLSAAASAPAAAQTSAPACQAGTFASYAALGTAGCQTGGVTFGGFATGYAELAGATVTPFAVSRGFGLTFTGFTLTPSPALTAGREGEAFLEFVLRAAAGSDPIVGVRVDQIDAMMGARAGGTAMLAPSALPGRAATVQLGAACLRATCATTADLFFAGTADTRLGGTLGVFDMGDGAAVLRSARFGVLTQAPASVVPEPSTYALFGAGLAAVAGVARRRARGSAA